MTQKPNATTHIQLSQISKAYPNGVQALRDINLQIAQGEIFGIIGRSGAGKSTLLRLFNRLENADSGEIIIHGEHTRHYSRSQLRDLRRRVAMIFQHFNLMTTKTVAQNVELPLKMVGVPRAERRRRVDEILALVGLSALRDSWYRLSFPGDKSSVPASPARWLRSRRSCCATKPPRPSTRKIPLRC